MLSGWLNLYGTMTVCVCVFTHEIFTRGVLNLGWLDITLIGTLITIKNHWNIFFCFLGRGLPTCWSTRFWGTARLPACRSTSRSARLPSIWSARLPSSWSASRPARLPSCGSARLPSCRSASRATRLPCSRSASRATGLPSSRSARWLPCCSWTATSRTTRICATSRTAWLWTTSRTAWIWTTSRAAWLWTTSRIRSWRTACIWCTARSNSSRSTYQLWRWCWWIRCPYRSHGKDGTQRIWTKGELNICNLKFIIVKQCTVGCEFQIIY